MNYKYLLLNSSELGSVAFNKCYVEWYSFALLFKIRIEHRWYMLLKFIPWVQSFHNVNHMNLFNATGKHRFEASHRKNKIIMSRARRKCLIRLYIVHQFTLKIIHNIQSVHMFSLPTTIMPACTMHTWFQDPSSELSKCLHFTCILYRIQNNLILQYMVHSTRLSEIILLSCIILHSKMWFNPEGSSYFDRNAGILMRLVK